MKKLMLLATMIIFCNTVNSQVTQQWVRSQHGAAYDVVMDQAGNIYVCCCGYTHYSDFMVIKYNTNGVRLWYREISGIDTGGIPEAAKCITVDPYGYVYAAGYVYNQNRGDHDYITVKYDSAGNEQWRKYYGLYGHNMVTSIAVDNSSNVYVTGHAEGFYTHDDYATVKYSSSGVQLWTFRYNGSAFGDDGAESIAIDGLGSVIVTGYSDEGSSGTDITTIKYSPSGILQWIMKYNGPANSHDAASKVTADALGNVYVTGTSAGSDGDDAVTIRYSSIGTQVWVSRYDRTGTSDEVGRDIKTDNQGNVYVTGDSNFGTDLYDMITLKYNSAGVQQWARIYNPNNYDDCGKSLVLDASNNVYVTGYSSTGPSEDDRDYATIKYNSAGVRLWVATYSGSAGLNDFAYGIAVKGSVIVVTGPSRGTDHSFNATTVKYIQTLILNPPLQRIEEQMTEVSGFVKFGDLDRAGGDELNIELQEAVDKIKLGDNNSAVKQLYACIDIVDELLRTSKLEPEYGDALISEINDIISNLNDKPGRQNEAPLSFALEQNYPNPFNPVTNIRFQIPRNAYVTLKIYDILGNEVAVLVNDVLEAKTYEVIWNAYNNASGVYFYKLEAGNFVETKKMILVK